MSLLKNMFAYVGIKERKGRVKRNGLKPFLIFYGNVVRRLKNVFT